MHYEWPFLKIFPFSIPPVYCIRVVFSCIVYCFEVDLFGLFVIPPKFSGYLPSIRYSAFHLTLAVPTYASPHMTS